MELTESDKLRFWKKVDRNGPALPNMDSPCWLWTACRNTLGYGTFGIGKKMHKAHRIAFILAGGVFQEEKPLCLHRCDNPQCCNPTHLFAGSIQDNSDDKMRKGRGHQAQGAKNGNSKLSDEQCDYIRTSSLSGAELGRELGVTRMHISAIRRGLIRKMS